MTYALQVKNELARLKQGRKCCQMAELTAFLRFSGSINISGKNISLNVITANPAVARRIFKLFKRLFGLNSELIVRRKSRLQKNNVYLIRIARTGRIFNVLGQLGLLKDGVLCRELPEAVHRKKCCRRAYLRGAFLAAGSISNPESSYHLEIYTDYQQHADDLAAVAATFGLQAKVKSRKNKYLVYIKDSEQIVEFLNISGAHSALLGFENIRILKDIRNHINRLVNFETANVGKTVKASVRQIQAIRRIEEQCGLDSLDPALRDIARLRLQNPEASLAELGEMLQPPLGKSGVNHRLRKIERISKGLAENNK